MSLIAELKRRNVFKVGIAYAVVGWLLLQFTDVLSQLLSLPPSFGPVVVAIVALGFPVVLFLAWAYELTPEGVKRESEVDRSQSITPVTGKKLNNAIVALLVLAVAWLLYDKFSTGPGSISSTVPAPGESTALEIEPDPTPAAAERLSIAVLPFDNRSNREEDQFFTDGIHDDLLTTIAKIKSMKVISRTSVMEYRGTTKKIPEIAAELGVAHVLEGGIQRSGDQVRINVQLIDAKTDEHLWAEIFDRELTAENLFAIQSEISKAIATALETTLSPEEEQRINTMPTQNLAAYDAYLRGRQLMATRDSADLEAANREFRQAVELDPKFALAWVGIADVNDLLVDYGTLDSRKALAIRQDAVQRALAIDPGLGEAHVSQATLLRDQGDSAAMEAEFNKAIELSPNYATAYHWYGNNLIGLSRAQEAVDMGLKALDLDPRSAIIGSFLASAYANQGLYSRTESQYRNLIELHPRFSQAYRSRAMFQGFSMGRFDLAIDNLRTAIDMDPGSPFGPLVLAWFSMEIGDAQAAEIYRQHMADLSDQDWRLGWTDLVINDAAGNPSGVREAWNWTDARAPNIPFLRSYAAMFLLANGDTNGARNLYLKSEPGWTAPAAWPRLVDMDPSVACLVAWSLSRTGDEETGAALLAQTLDYLPKLPEFIEHDDAWNPQFCYLMAGDTERALTLIETQLAHNHLFGWRTFDRLPMYEAIRFEPRYQAALAERDRRLAEQREAVIQGRQGASS